MTLENGNTRSSLALFAPESYWQATPEQLNMIVNGCGTSGWKGKLVPEKLWGVSVSESCNIHDWMYHHGVDIKDKEQADRVFLNNMLRTIECSTSNGFVKKLRIRRARVYHHAVCYFGGPAFWENKNKPDQVKLAKYAHVENTQ